MLAATILTCLGAQATYACQCEQRQAPCAQYWSADAVFAGKVVLIRELENRVSKEIQFNVQQAFRGVDSDALQLVDYGSSCDYVFEEGKEYLVYAYRNTSSPTVLYTHYCTRTTELSKAANDLAYIKSLSTEKQPNQIVGVLADGDKRLPKIDIVASNGRSRYRTKSDNEGWFRLTVPQSGKYHVRIYLPRYADVVGTQEQLDRISNRIVTKTHVILEYEAIVESGRCVFINPPLVVDYLEYKRSH